jgi:hypothetical protein
MTKRKTPMQDGKYTTFEALLQNAQHFFDSPGLLKGIHGAVKKKATFEDVLQFTPSELLQKGLKLPELKKLINILGKYNWILTGYVRAGYNCNLIQEHDFVEKPKVEYGRDLTDEEVDKGFKEAEEWQDIIDKENTTPAEIQ